ncbi:MAG: tripartite tricarboxylate transporter substrate binding protein [Alcanivorax sp.]
MKTKNRNVLAARTLLGLALSSLSLLVTPAWAADYPSRPVTEIVPYPAGGSTDLAGRAVANAMSEILGDKVVVDNRSGGGGSVGMAALARARADGYTIGVAPVGTIANQPHMHRTPYSAESFDYLCQFYYAPQVLAVKPGSPFKTLKDVVDYAKAHPGELTYGTPGPGTLPHLQIEQFKRLAGADITHVPFAGDGPGLTALMGGHIDLYFALPNTVTDRDLRAVAVFSDAPIEALPDLKTAIQQGYDMTAAVAGGLVAPKGIPEDVRDRLASACEQATESEALKTVLGRVGLDAVYLDPRAFQDLVLSTSKTNGELIRDVLKGGGH